MNMNASQIEIVDRDMARFLTQKTEGERLRVAWGMWRSARRMLTLQIKSENSGQSDAQILQEVSRRLSSGT